MVSINVNKENYEYITSLQAEEIKKKKKTIARNDIVTILIEHHKNSNKTKK